MAPNQYSRIEINLLPPELRPKPAVRYTALVNAAVIAVTVLLIGFDAYFGFARIGELHQQQQTLQEELKRREPIKQDYLALKEIENDLSAYGRIISMASSDYLDMPVVLARVAQLLPEGVYLDRVTNQGSKNRGAAIQLAITLRSATRDEKLLIQTLTNFKNDPILSNCYMRNADLSEMPIDTLLTQFNANWEVTTPDSFGVPQNLEYEFLLLVNLDRVLPEDGLMLAADEADFFQGFALEPAPETPADGATEVPGSRTPPAASSNAPADVKVEGTN